MRCTEGREKGGARDGATAGAETEDENWFPSRCSRVRCTYGECVAPLASRRRASRQGLGTNVHLEMPFGAPAPAKAPAEMHVRSALLRACVREREREEEKERICGAKSIERVFQLLLHRNNYALYHVNPARSLRTCMASPNRYVSFVIA